MLDKFKPLKGKEGTSIFKAPIRKNLFQVSESPGPQQYIIEKQEKQRSPGIKHPFGVNTMRFQVTDHEVPGAGMYPLPDSVQIKNPAKIHASFKSSV